MLNSIKKIENKITVVQEILVSLHDELSVLKTKFATEKNNNNNNNNIEYFFRYILIYFCDTLSIYGLIL